MLLEITKRRAAELGLITCKCGHPKNNHFGDGKNCARCECWKYEEVGVYGIKVIKPD
jgi:hypothetical protein